MALNRKDNPTGIDKLIDRWQKIHYDGVVDGRGWINYESYARVYRDIKDDKINPLDFTTNSDYKKVLMNDKFNVTSFFLVSNVSDESEGMTSATISLIIQGDLAKLFPLSPHRFDEELINDVKASNRNLDGRFKSSGIVRGIDDVYAGFDTEAIKKGLHDRQPYNVVRFDMDVKYQYACTDEYARGDCTVKVSVSTTPETSIGADDGTATANVTEGQGNISYLWNDPLAQETQTAVGLAPNTYTVTVTDDNALNCTTQGVGTVEEGTVIPVCNLVLVNLIPTAPTISGGNDGSVLAVFSGNAGVVSILWSDGQTVNPAVGLSEGDIGMVGTDLDVDATCKVVGSTIVPQGTLDNAMFFDAINDHATSSTDVVMSGAFLFQTEFEYTNAISFTRLISSSNSNYINITDSTTIVTRAGSTRIFTVAAMSSATKHHLVVRRDASNVVNVFVDGIKYASGASTILGAFTFNRISGVTGNFSMFGGKLKNLGLVAGDFSDTVVANLFADPSTFVAEVGTCSFYEMNQDNDLEQMVDTGGDDINYHTFGYAVGAPKFVAW